MAGRVVKQNPAGATRQGFQKRRKSTNEINYSTNYTAAQEAVFVPQNAPGDPVEYGRRNDGDDDMKSEIAIPEKVREALRKLVKR